MKNLKLVVAMLIVFIAFGALTLRISSAEENSCLTCHSDLKKHAKNVHAAMGMGCAICHKRVEGKSHPDQKGSIKLIQDMPGLCYSCHDESKFKGKSVHQPVASGMCTACHNPHQSDFRKILLKDVPDLCYNCHEESKFKGKSGHTAVGMCTGCHSPHSSNSDKLLKDNQPELCYTCHDKAKFTKKYVHAVVNMPNGCSTCHSPHLSDQPSLLIKNVNDLCVTCHLEQSKGEHITSSITVGSRRKYHPIRGVTDPRFPGKPKKIPDPNRPGRQIEVFDPNNPGKEMNCASCHNPHSSDFPKLFPAANVCQLCHKYY